MHSRFHPPLRARRRGTRAARARARFRRDRSANGNSRRTATRSSSRCARSKRAAPAAHEVAVRVRAVSLNRRDLMMVAGSYGRGGTQPNSVPLSDGAGEVIAVGAASRASRSATASPASSSRTGSTAHRRRQRSRRRAAATRAACSPRSSSRTPKGSSRSPRILSYEEAATLPCAGVTAWVGAVQARRPRSRRLRAARRHGRRVGVRPAARGRGRRQADHHELERREARARARARRVRHRELPQRTPNGRSEVRTLTGGAGVDQVLEVGGQDTLPRALEALGFGGHIAIIGGLSGFASDVPVGALMGLERDGERHLRRLARRFRGAERVLRPSTRSSRSSTRCSSSRTRRPRSRPWTAATSSARS